MLKPSMAFQPRVVTRFRREADILRQLRHPHILQFIDEFEAAGTLFTAIEFCEGQTLDAIIKAHGRLELGVVKQIVGQLASALLASHGQGVVHRDLKPANVMIATSGEVKLADFGVALLRRNPGLTRHTEMLGTPRYMAPEQLLGEPAKPATDIFALACITYEMLVGRPAQPGNTLAEIIEGVQRNLWPSPEIFSDVQDPQVRAFLARALRRSPTERELDLSLLAQWA
jgi:serine/threonine-protein kinase